MTIIIDGTATTPGCKCGMDCPMPCWQRVGIAPACEACGCAAFDAYLDPNDRAADLARMPDLWPEIERHLGHAAATALDAADRSLDLRGRLDGLEAKFRKGEAEHGRDWLHMTRAQIEQEIDNEWADLILYHAMIAARFRDGTVT